MRRRRSPYKGRRKRDPHNINERIRAREVRVVGENVDGGQAVMNTDEAVELAEKEGLDLVEISPNADPPVCKIIDYKKFLYDQKKKQKAMKQKSSKTVTKEIRFGPNTDDHDYEFKKNHAIKFIKDGAKVKAFVFFKGRTIIFKDRGKILLLRLAQDLEDIATVEKMPKMEGKRMIMFLAPKKN